jgi:hypothetical protein
VAADRASSESTACHSPLWSSLRCARPTSGMATRPTLAPSHAPGQKTRQPGRFCGYRPRYWSWSPSHCRRRRLLKLAATQKGLLRLPARGGVTRSVGTLGRRGAKIAPGRCLFRRAEALGAGGILSADFPCHPLPRASWSQSYPSPGEQQIRVAWPGH